MTRTNWTFVMAWTTVFAIFGTGTVWAQRVRAGTNGWRNIGPQGGAIQTLSIDPHNPRTLYAATGGLYAATGVAGAFQSMDGGARWVKSSVPNQPLIFDPQDPNTIYTFDSTTGISTTGISKSTDSGTSWNPANSGLPACSTCSP